MISLLRKFWLKILDILFPLNCLGCKKSAKTILCQECLRKIPLNQTLLCALCSRRLADGKKICHKKSPYLLAAAGSYQNPILKQLIWILKYRRFQPAAKTIAEILNSYLEITKIDFSQFKLAPIPLHPDRQRQRGFNQTELIAAELAKLLKIKIMDCLIRIRNNRPQVEMENWDQRKINMEECFSAAKNAELKNQSIILVDDVSTSGATFESAAEVLKKAGVKKIIGLTLAKG